MFFSLTIVSVGGALCLLPVGVGGVLLPACDRLVVVWVSVVSHCVHGVGVSVLTAPHHPDCTSTPLFQHLLQTRRETAAPSMLMSP